MPCKSAKNDCGVATAGELLRALECNLAKLMDNFCVAGSPQNFRHTPEIAAQIPGKLAHSSETSSYFIFIFRFIKHLTKHHPNDI